MKNSTFSKKLTLFAGLFVFFGSGYGMESGEPDYRMEPEEISQKSTNSCINTFEEDKRFLEALAQEIVTRFADALFFGEEEDDARFFVGKERDPRFLSEYDVDKDNFNFINEILVSIRNNVTAVKNYLSTGGFNPHNKKIHPMLNLHREKTDRDDFLSNNIDTNEKDRERLVIKFLGTLFYEETMEDIRKTSTSIFVNDITRKDLEKYLKDFFAKKSNSLDDLSYTAAKQRSEIEKNFQAFLEKQFKKSKSYSCDEDFLTRLIEEIKCRLCAWYAPDFLQTHSEELARLIYEDMISIKNYFRNTESFSIFKENRECKNNEELKIFLRDIDTNQENKENLIIQYLGKLLLTAYENPKKLSKYISGKNSLIEADSLSDDKTALLKNFFSKVSRAVCLMYNRTEDDEELKSKIEKNFQAFLKKQFYAPKIEVMEKTGLPEELDSLLNKLFLHDTRFLKLEIGHDKRIERVKEIKKILLQNFFIPYSLEYFDDATKKLPTNLHYPLTQRSQIVNKFMCTFFQEMFVSNTYDNALSSWIAGPFLLKEFLFNSASTLKEGLKYCIDTAINEQKSLSTKTDDQPANEPHPGTIVEGYTLNNSQAPSETDGLLSRARKKIKRFAQWFTYSPERYRRLKQTDEEFLYPDSDDEFLS